MLVVDWAARQQYSLAVRFAALTHDLGKGVTPAEFWPKHHGHEGKGVDLVKALSERLRVPTECRELATAVARDHGNIHRALSLRPATVVELLERLDAFRRPQRFGEILQACECDFHGRPGWEQRPYLQTLFLQGALNAARTVNASDIAKCTAPANIRQAIFTARSAAVAAWKSAGSGAQS
jgi:tRNA nucleotidyltransferase (CCA-adding enzyme)